MPKLWSARCTPCRAVSNAVLYSGWVGYEWTRDPGPGDQCGCVRYVV